MPADVRLIAFHLPQFHPIPENDEWWGPGFTEWTNVIQARPLYEGHDQPRIPADLGYYDLRVSQVRHAQADLARAYGIHGFCYYYYWFSGRRLLERPLELVLADRALDFPFCVCWANENWSRRWDGSEQDILIEQGHHAEDPKRFIEDLARVLTDRRYITVDGAPLLLVYRPDIIPNLRDVVRSWRLNAQRLDIPQLHLCAVQSFGYVTGLEDGFDSLVEFPPHNLPLRENAARPAGLDPAFRGRMFTYTDVVRYSCGSVSGIGTPIYRGVMTAWDNTPRRRLNGTIFEGSTPERYYVWLRRMVEYTRLHHTGDRRLVFINAWNEWAEGAYLEPDETFQHQYLDATARALSNADDPAPLIELLRQKTDGDQDARALLDRLEAAVKTQTATINLIDGCGVPPPIVSTGAVPGRFLSVHRSPVELPDTIVLDDEIESNLETLNTPHYQDGVTLNRAYDVLLTGWIASSRIPVGCNSSVLFQLTNLESGERYLAEISGRVRRDDVVAHLELHTAGRVPEACSLYSGYRVLLSIATVEPGAYSLDVIVPIAEGQGAVMQRLHSPAIVL